MTRGAYLLNLGRFPYLEAWDLQRSLAAAVAQGAIPDTVVLLEHPPVSRSGGAPTQGELHLPDGREVEVVETNRGGKSTYHGPGSSSATRSSTSTATGRTSSATCATSSRRSSGRSRRSGSRRRRRGATGVWLRVAAAQDRLDRRPRLALGDDPRLRPQRRPRPGAVHGLDHRLRPRGRAVHDDGARARPAA